MTINAASRSLTIVPSSDGIMYSKYPAGDYPSVGLSLTVRSMSQTAGDNGTITIPRYATVLFDLSGSTAATLDVPFIELLAHHDYGYATPGTPGNHTQSGEVRGNDVGGLVRAHTYLTAGTYEYTVRVKVPSGGYSEASCTIIVQEPADYFTNTVAITNATGAWPTWASDTLYTLADNLSASTWGALNIATGNPGVHDVWIMGNPSARAVVGSSVTVGRNNPGSANIVESYNIGFIGITGATEIGVDYGSSVYYDSVSARNIFTSKNEHYSTYGGTNFKRPSGASYSRCSITQSGADTIGLFSNRGEEYGAIIDCSFDMGTATGGIHVARPQSMYKSVIAHSKFFGTELDGAYLTIRPLGTDSWVRGYNDSLAVECAYVVIANNIFGDATDGTIPTLPTSAMPSAGVDRNIRYVTWISNTYTNAQTTQLSFGGEYLAVMDSGLAASEIAFRDETEHPLMDHADFIPVYSEHGFADGYLANERITLPAFEDPGKAGT